VLPQVGSGAGGWHVCGGLRDLMFCSLDLISTPRAVVRGLRF